MSQVSTQRGYSGAVETAQLADARSTVGGGSPAGVGPAPSAAAATPGRASAVKAPADPARSLGTGLVTPAHARSTAADSKSVAIITPTLKTLRFGSVFGLPNGCDIFVGIFDAGAGEAGAGEAGSTFTQGVEQCTAAGNASGEQLTAAMAQLEPLVVINPLFNPGIDAFAAALESIGRDQRATVSPFGPTIAGFAADARFFKGCEPC